MIFPFGALVNILMLRDYCTRSGILFRPFRAENFMEIYIQLAHKINMLEC